MNEQEQENRCALCGKETAVLIGVRVDMDTREGETMSSVEKMLCPECMGKALQELLEHKRGS